MKIKVGDSLDNIKLTSIDDKIFELKKVLGSKILLTFYFIFVPNIFFFIFRN